MNPSIQAYIDLKVYIFPCYWVIDTDKGRACACGVEGCKSPGKHPIKELVPNGHKDASNDADLITTWWSTYPKANVALSLAESGLVVIDIDPRNGGNGTFDDLEAKHGKIASDVEQLTGGGGRHIVYIANHDSKFPGKLGPGVDVKHQGYIMVWPSNHILGDYEWEASSDLTEGMIPSLAPSWLALPSGDEYNTDIKPALPGLGLATLLEAEIDEIKSALLFIPNSERDDWLHVGMALHSIDSGRDGFQLWEDWSSSCSKFDAQDQARVWFSFHGKATQLNKQSIFHIAAENGWINPLKKVVSDEVKAVSEKVLLTLVNNTNPSIDESSIAKPEITLDLPFPVGGLEEVAQLIGTSSYVNYPDASRLAAVQLACLSASRRYVGDNGEGCHVYFGLSSVSVGMIRYTVNALQTILTDAGMRQLFSSSRKSTAGIIHDHLIRRPVHLYCVEDFGKMLQQSKKQFGNGSMEHALDTLGSIYSKSILQIDQDDITTKGNNSETKVVYQPALSMLGLVSQDQLSQLTRSSEIGSGLMVNMLVAIVDENKAITHDDVKQINIPEWLIHQLATMRGFHPVDRKADKSFDFSNDRGDFQPTEQIIVPMPSAKMYDAKIMVLAGKQKNLIPMLHGARVTMRRISIALAAWNNPTAPVVTDDIMAWSSDFVYTHAKRFVDEFGVSETDDDGKLSMYQKVLKIIIDKGIDGATKDDMRYCRQFKVTPPDAKRALLELMEDNEDVQFTKIGTKKRYIATRFITSPGKTSQLRATPGKKNAPLPGVDSSKLAASESTPGGRAGIDY